MAPPHLAVGALVRCEAAPDWGVGQIQSIVGNRVTVTFEHAGQELNLVPNFDIAGKVRRLDPSTADAPRRLHFRAVVFRFLPTIEELRGFESDLTSEFRVDHVPCHLPDRPAPALIEMDVFRFASVDSTQGVHGQSLLDRRVEGHAASVHDQHAPSLAGNFL